MPHSIKLWHVKPIVACCEDPTKQQIYRAARAYRAAGLSFIPISANGSKQPAFELLPLVIHHNGKEQRSWGIYKERQPTRDEVNSGSTTRLLKNSMESRLWAAGSVGVWRSSTSILLICSNRGQDL